MENLSIYNSLRTPPPDALRPIKAGRMQGKTDISPQWRTEAMTAQFGPCGIGWYYEIVGFEESVSPAGEVALFCSINLFFKHEGEWSRPIPGVGGSMLVANEKRGPYVDDDARKKALTDALSVAMKAVGVAADVYRGMMDGSKFGNTNAATAQSQPSSKPPHIEALSNRAAQIGLKEWVIATCQQTEGLPNNPRSLSPEQAAWIGQQMEDHYARLMEAKEAVGG